MEQLVVFHITDLHLDDIESTNENLRRAFYKEFIGELVEKIKETVTVNIDLVVCTGDFINQGKVLNFTHAKTVLDYLINKLNVSPNNVALTIGNHDLIRVLDADGKEFEARANYASLEKNFHLDKVLIDKSFFKIFYSESKDLYILTFDSTWNSKGSNKPGKLSDKQIDEIITSVDEYIPQEKVLLVLSHYPMILFNRSQAVAEVDDWVDNHLWKSGNMIVERIYKKRKNHFTFWFFGDGHLPDFWSYNQFQHFLMTGMIGGNYVNPTYKNKISGDIKAFNKTNEVKIIILDYIKKRIEINTFSYQSKAYEFSPHTGYWEKKISTVRTVDNPFEIEREKQNSTDVISIPKNHDLITNLISESVQDEIINEIREKKIYSFNRYSTSKNQVSLGWVSFNKLFENNELLSRCIVKCNDWINKILDVILLKDDTLFIGIDFWGAIFASQTSILSNIENYCVATKSNGQHNVLLEKPEFLSEKIEKKKKSLKNIVLFTDVISTGNTVISVLNKISNCLDDIHKINWIAVSIISDIKQTRKTELSNFTAIGSLCVDLRIPILSNNDLPDIDILPIKYDIR